VAPRLSGEPSLTNRQDDCAFTRASIFSRPFAAEPFIKLL